MSKAVVVLGMHRSGTSLVASMLHAMGVDMGAFNDERHPSQPQKHWEDVRFVNVNTDILADRGGTWDDPPPDLNPAAFRPDVPLLVQERIHPGLLKSEPGPLVSLWGFKDPRTCLTAAFWHRYLPDPHYVVVHRREDAIVDSLEWREGRAGSHWRELTRLYLAARDDFLSQVSAPKLDIYYERLIDQDTAAAETQKLALFLGIDLDDAVPALDRIQVRGNAPMTSRPDWLQRALGLHLGPITDTRPAVVILGDPGSYPNQVRSILPQARVVPVTPQWSHTWRSLHGPVQALIVPDGRAIPTVDLERWICRVRPGGLAVVASPPTERRLPTAWQPLPAPGEWMAWTRKPYLRAGDPFGSVGIGCPYYKADYNFWRWWAWLVRYGLEPEDRLLNDASVMAPLPIPVVHNRLMARFLEGDRDTFLIVEDDHCGDPPELIDFTIVERMRAKTGNHAFDIVTANYVNRRADPGIVGYRLAARPNRHGEYLCILEYDDVWRTGTQPVDGSVFGLALIRRWVLDAMLDLGNPRTMQWCEWRGGNSQDVNFYGKARALTNCKVGVDRDANIGHVAQTIRSVSDFWERRKH